MVVHFHADPMHDHDRRNYDTPQHRSQQQLTATAGNWEDTRSNWRVRLPQDWNRIRADWNARTGGWHNFR